jgi:hypothetical protein
MSLYGIVDALAPAWLEKAKARADQPRVTTPAGCDPDACEAACRSNRSTPVRPLLPVTIMRLSRRGSHPRDPTRHLMSTSPRSRELLWRHRGPPAFLDHARCAHPFRRTRRVCDLRGRRSVGLTRRLTIPTCARREGLRLRRSVATGVSPSRSRGQPARHTCTAQRAYGCPFTAPLCPEARGSDRGWG